jgi:hypothetical protein
MTSVTLIKIILEQSETSEKDALQSNFEENKKQTEKGFEFWICLERPKKKLIETFITKTAVSFDSNR